MEYYYIQNPVYPSLVLSSNISLLKPLTFLFPSQYLFPSPYCFHTPCLSLLSLPLSLCLPPTLCASQRRYHATTLSATLILICFCKPADYSGNKTINNYNELIKSCNYNYIRINAFKYVTSNKIIVWKNCFIHCIFKNDS